MGWILWIIVGGILGWLASLIMRTNAQQGLLLNIVVGIVGAILAGWLISPLLGIEAAGPNNFSIGGLLVALVGALILLAIVNLFTRRSVR
ncbi:MAG: GlsB/YeaQ/YmgE family stress response membrane protein [Caldilineaceae bacterium]|nr:GlsB/YeaQ/YmgE family stress response membrane protein [Caldilineaceae bacterium]